MAVDIVICEKQCQTRLSHQGLPWISTMGRCMKSGAVETRNLSGKTFFIGRSWKWAFETRQQDLTPWSAFRTLEFSTCALRGKGSSPESGQSPTREQLPDAIQGSNSQWDFSRHQFTAVIASRGSLLLHRRARCHDAAREHLLQAATRAQAKKVKGEAASSPVCIQNTANKVTRLHSLKMQGKQLVTIRSQIVVLGSLA